MHVDIFGIISKLQLMNLVNGLKQILQKNNLKILIKIDSIASLNSSLMNILLVIVE